MRSYCFLKGKKDNEYYTGCFGEIDRENNIPADEESVYDWGSITKNLTWVSVLQLYEQGKLDLNEDIRSYLPDGFIQHAKYDDPITMMNLMNHNAGWCESTYDIFAYDESDLHDLGTMLQSIESLVDESAPLFNDPETQAMIFESSGFYMASRTYKKGILKFMGYMSIWQVSKTGEDSFSSPGMCDLTRIGNDLYIWHDTYNGRNMLVSGKTLDDGRYVIQLGSEDYVQDNAAVAKLVLLAVYLVSVVISLFLLVIKLITTLIRVLVRKKKSYEGSVMMTLAEGSRLLVLASMLFIYMNLKGGVIKPIGIVFAAANILCGMVCLFAVVNDVKVMMSDSPEKAKAGKYISNMIVNGVCVFALIFLETYRFWGFRFLDL
ncbi:MAG: beta-lactamase family protein [Oscillospiraceae bacterium]|nr:beta-lactamase family protein [Oscillospiraceae bacterium]